MNERIIDIIIWLISQIKTNNIEDINTQHLSEKGYSDKEVSTAYCWVTEKLENNKPNEIMRLQIFPQKSFRYFNEFEKTFFSKDAIGNIIQMQSIGLIDSQHIDFMMEKALELGFGEINSDMVKQYIAAFMFDASPYGYTGNKTTIDSWDLIN